MAYQFKSDEAAGAAAQRVASGQLTRLDKLLRDDAEIATGHHRTRKCIKRLRALLLAMPSAIGARRWRRLDRQLADIGRALARERDHAVILDVLARITDEHPEDAIRNAGAMLRKSLMQRRFGAKGANGAQGPAAGDRDKLRADLKLIGARIEGLPFHSVSADAIVSDVAAEYRRGRKAVDVAYDEDTDEAFHTVRKHAQRHGRHMQLLLEIWPQALQARIDLAKQLSDLLGEDHDLSLLRGALKDARGSGAKAALTALDRLCQVRQHAVRLKVRPMLERFFAEKTKALEARLAAYWRADGSALIPPVQAPEPQPQPPVPDRSLAAQSGSRRAPRSRPAKNPATAARRPRAARPA